MKLIKKRTSASVAVPTRQPGQALGHAVNRRTFIKGSGLAAAGAAAATLMTPTMMKKAHAATMPKAGVKTDIKRSVCTHCSVGCGVIAEVQNGVWTGQEPDFASPFNMGSHTGTASDV